MTPAPFLLLAFQGSDKITSRAVPFLIHGRTELRNKSVPALAIAALVSFLCSPSLAQTANGDWVTAWGASQQGLGQTGIANATVRLIARVTLPGESIRIRLDNTFGPGPGTFSHTQSLPRDGAPA